MALERSNPCSGRETLRDKPEDPDRSEEDEESPQRHLILCTTCRHELTTSAARIEVEGSHRHVKLNPHGHVFDFACFYPVKGALAIGSPSSEWSWFSGWRWQLCLCGGCQVHLGWTFTGEGQFVAMVEGRFIEEQSSG